MIHRNELLDFKFSLTASVFSSYNLWITVMNTSYQCSLLIKRTMTLRSVVHNVIAENRNKKFAFLHRISGFMHTKHKSSLLNIHRNIFIETSGLYRSSKVACVCCISRSVARHAITELTLSMTNHPWNPDTAMRS